jgi:hypothetical protein
MEQSKNPFFLESFMAAEQKQQDQEKDHPVPPPKVFEITIDKKLFKVERPFISGAEIKKLAGVDPNFGVWLKINGPGEDLQIDDTEKVDLTKNGVEHFFTGPTQTTAGSHVIPS